MTITVTTPTTIIVQDPSARGAIGPAGPTGPTGPNGANGASANVQVGNVITGAEGSSVTITNVGNTTNVILDFSIPRGNTGNSVNLSSVTSNVIPSSNNTYNLGSPQFQWKDLYVSNNTIYMGNVPLSIDANGALRVNGSIVSSANTGNIAFQNNIVVGTGVGQTDGLYLAAGAGQVANLQYLRLRGGDDDAHIHFDTANTEAYDFYFGDDSKYIKLERGYNGNVVIGTYGGDGFKTWNFASNGNLTLPGQIHGFTTYGGGDIPNGRVVDIVPADDASDKTFKFRIDQYGETFTRAYFEMPEAQNNKQVAIAFRHANGNTGYIYTQGADTYDDGLNNAFNIFYNSGDIKVTAMTPGTGVYNTWKFGGNGALTFPDNTVQTTAYTGGGAGLPLANGTSNIDIPAANGYVTVTANTFIWTFDDTNGSIDLPGNVTNSEACSAINFVANSSGDGNGYSTIELRPDSNAVNDQYLIIDPTVINHIHIRAGGQQDNSNGQLFLGGEYSNFSVGSGLYPPVFVTANQKTWTFGVDGVSAHPVLEYANLPPASTAGLRAFISDANTAASGNFGAVIGGGGSNNVPVFSDGTNWRIG